MAISVISPSPPVPVLSVNNKTGNVVLNKTDIGLNNVDNTSDANKPISTAMQTALDAKQPNLTAGQNISISGSTIGTKAFPCNPNLLDNWYFGNPVNQRGQTSYTGVGYTVDRWRINGGGLSVTSTGLQFDASYVLFQPLDLPISLPNTIATVSFMLADGNVYSGLLSAGYAAVGPYSVANDNSNILYINKATANAPNILAVKLELGSVQTLAHQENGNWVLNEIPDYGEQLYRCITSTADTSDTYANRAFVGVADGPGAHNAVYRGQNLGSAVTDAQWAAIANGTFKDMYIGDYWVIGGVNWRIAAFDYYMTTGWEAAVTEHHVTIVPDSALYSHVMNDTDVTTGAYVGSKMYTEGLTQAKATINNAFGSAHILNHRQWLTNATANGYATGGSWYDSTVELMTEQNVYGGKIFANCQQGTGWAAQYTIDKSQYPLFAHNPYLISNRTWYWLRDVASAATFCYVDGYGYANNNYASYVIGVRPAFSIKS